MSSETDSEHDRRAYGQYASLAAEGDSDIDEEAASYLRSVRQVYLVQAAYPVTVKTSTELEVHTPLSQMCCRSRTCDTDIIYFRS